MKRSTVGSSEDAEKHNGLQLGLLLFWLGFGAKNQSLDFQQVCHWVGKWVGVCPDVEQNVKTKKSDFIVKPFAPSKIYANNMVCINLQRPHTATHVSQALSKSFSFRQIWRSLKNKF